MGPPNVGKSSLLNALLGTDRAIVSPVPGTTRDTVEESIVLAGFPVRLIDTAGVRPSTDPIEQEGIQRTRTAAEQAELRSLIQRQADLTGSTRAAEVLANWEAMLPKFVKIMPRDYKRMLECIANAQAQGLTGDEAIMAAFEENARDTSRVGGN